MNKISLVSRRRDQCFDAPTKASLRARERQEEEAQSAEETQAIAPDLLSRQDIAVGMQDGAPTVEIEVPADQRLSLEELAHEYLDGKDSAEIRTSISKEKTGEKWGLKIQFIPEHTSRMLSTKELATMLGVGIHTVNTLRKNKKIKGYQAGSRWRYIWTEVLSALEDSDGK